jgi:hypothetical protein
MCFMYKQFMYKTQWRTQTIFFKQISIKSINFLKVEFLHALKTLAKSSSFIYNFFTYSNTNILVVKVDERTYLRDSVSATMFSLSYLYLIAHGKFLINSTYLACHRFNLPCPFKCFKHSWSKWMINSLVQRYCCHVSNVLTNK